MEKREDLVKKYLRLHKSGKKYTNPSQSSVAYVMGFTDEAPTTDPKFKTTVDRIQPPDVDMDIEDISRHLVLELLSQNFDTMQIGTFTGLGTYVDDATGNEGGSIFRTYLTYLRRMLEEEAWSREEDQAEKEGRKPVKYKAIAEAKERFYKHGFNQLQSLEEIKDISRKDWRLLRKMSEMDLYKSYGVHAAGVLISGADMKVDEWVPSMLVASSDTCVVGSTRYNTGSKRAAIPSRYTVEGLYRVLYGNPDARPDECEGCGRKIAARKIRLDTIHRCPSCVQFYYRFRRDGGLLVEGRDDQGTISLQKLTNVFYKGRKEVFSVRLENGSELVATADHRHLTESGWCEVENLSVGDRLAVRGLAWKGARTRRKTQGKMNTFTRRTVLDVATRAGRVCEHCRAPEPHNGTHHMAHVTYDNNLPENLLYLCGVCHRKFDADARSTRFSMGIPVDYSKIVSISKLLEVQDVYDVSIDSKDHSWVANNIVTHNCVSQYTMKDVEKLGFMKGDWLGQTSLTVMRLCQEMIGRDSPTDFTWIPLDDAETMRTCRDFRQDTGIFHLEGWTKGKGAKSLGVKNVEDLVRVQALFMPGAMNSGATDLFLQRHKSVAARNKVTYSHPLLEEVLGPTYGCLIYQEQVLDLARGVGITDVELQDFFKIIKKAGSPTPDNEARMDHAFTTFVKHARKTGLSNEAIDEAWTSIESMGGYGFNRAHAVAYGLRTYRTAYLKTHYPVEYMTALLTSWEGTKKEAAYIAEARRIKIHVLPAMVNVSGESWTIDKAGGAIRRGLRSIDGVGVVSAGELAAQQPFKSLTDLAMRCNPRKVSGCKGLLETGELTGVLAKLDAAGALEDVKDEKDPNPPF